MKSIGIKLADGSFYPVLTEGSAENKMLELTTVQDNQTTVQIDLYRSETGSMNDAEYVDTLEIRNMKPHPNGEPNLKLDISLDENNQLKAEVMDPETGKVSETQVRLVSRTLAERSEPVNFNIDEVSENGVELANESTEDTDVFANTIANDLPPIDTEDNDMIGTSPNDEDFSFDSLNSDAEAANNISADLSGIEKELDLPDVEEETPLPDVSEEDIFATENILSDNTEDSNLLDEETADSLEAEAAFLGLKNEENTGSILDDLNLDSIEESAEPSDSAQAEDSNGVVADDFDFTSLNAESPLVESSENSSELPDFDLPETSDEVATDSESENSEFSVDSIIEEPVSDDFELPDFDGTSESENSEETLPDTAEIEVPAFDTETSSEESFQSEESMEIPSDENIETDVNAEESVSDDFELPDFDSNENVAENSEITEDTSSIIEESVSDDFELPDFGNEESTESEIEIPQESIVEESENSSDSFDLPDFGEETSETSDESNNIVEDSSTAFGIPDFSEEVPEENSIAEESIEENESIVEDNSADFELPDFGEEESVPEPSNDSFDLPDFDDDTSATPNESETPSFDLPNFDEVDLSDTETSTDDFIKKDATFVPENSMFNDLYDSETKDGITAESKYNDKKQSSKTKVHVIICLICTIICVAAALLVLFVIPSKMNIAKKIDKTNNVETPADKTTTVDEPEAEIADTSSTIVIERQPLPEPIPDPEPEVVIEDTSAKENEIVVAETPQAVVPETPSAPAEKPKDVHYKIRWGDTLWDIADSYYKNPWRYKYLARYNGIKNPNKIISGTWIWIPAE